ncbi:hypothetical protein IWQ61_009906 [Dispira simplex]|nr:hypothetical protein IWQ61_009906 [Dispira simplex]
MLASPHWLCEHTQYVQPRDLLARFHVAWSNPSPTGQTMSWLVSNNLLGLFQQASHVSLHQLALWQWQLTTVANDHAFPSVLRHALIKCDPDQRALKLLASESPQVAILYTHPEQDTTPRTFHLTHQSVLGVHYVLLCPWQVVEEF